MAPWLVAVLMCCVQDVGAAEAGGGAGTTGNTGTTAPTGTTGTTGTAGTTGTTGTTAATGTTGATGAASATGTTRTTGADPVKLLSTADCDFYVAPKPNAQAEQAFHFGMGESLSVRTKTCAEQVLTSATPRAWTLYFDNVALVGLPVTAHNLKGDEAELTFELRRDTRVADSRKAWDAFFDKQNEFVMEPTLDVGIGNGPSWPVVVPGNARVTFAVAKGSTIVWTLVVGIVLLVGTFLGLTFTRALRDDDGTYSLGKSQMAFWGLLVFLTFFGVWIVTGSVETIPTQVLVLLGISGGTGLSAVLINAGKQQGLRDARKELLDRQTTQPAAFTAADQARLNAVEADLAVKTIPKRKAWDFFREICSDGGGLSFHRLQMVIWTIVLGAIFIWTVKRTMSMPEFPDSLLLLMGISSGTYLGFKFPEKV